MSKRKHVFALYNLSETAESIASQISKKLQQSVSKDLIESALKSLDDAHLATRLKLIKTKNEPISVKVWRSLEQSCLDCLRLSRQAGVALEGWDRHFYISTLEQALELPESLLVKDISALASRLKTTLATNNIVFSQVECLNVLVKSQGFQNFQSYKKHYQRTIGFRTIPMDTTVEILLRDFMDECPSYEVMTQKLLELLDYFQLLEDNGYECDTRDSDFINYTYQGDMLKKFKLSPFVTFAWGEELLALGDEVSNAKMVFGDTNYLRFVDDICEDADLKTLYPNADEIIKKAMEKSGDERNRYLGEMIMPNAIRTHMQVMEDLQPYSLVVKDGKLTGISQADKRSQLEILLNELYIIDLNSVSEKAKEALLAQDSGALGIFRGLARKQ